MGSGSENLQILQEIFNINTPKKISLEKSYLTLVYD